MESRPREEITRFFDRPGEEVIADMSAHWRTHLDSRGFVNKEGQEGQSIVLALQAGTILRYFRVESAVVFSHEYTMDRWPNTRGPMIASLEPGQIVAFSDRGRMLLFFRTQGAENIMPESLQEIDRFNTPLSGDEHILTATKIAPVLGLRHNMTGTSTPIQFRGERALLLTAGEGEVGKEELDRIERALLEGFDPNDIRNPFLNTP